MSWRIHRPLRVAFRVDPEGAVVTLTAADVRAKAREILSEINTAE